MLATERNDAFRFLLRVYPQPPKRTIQIGVHVVEPRQASPSAGLPNGPSPALRLLRARSVRPPRCGVSRGSDALLVRAVCANWYGTTRGVGEHARGRTVEAGVGDLLLTSRPQ